MKKEEKKRKQGKVLIIKTTKNHNLNHKHNEKINNKLTLKRKRIQNGNAKHSKQTNLEIN